MKEEIFSTKIGGLARNLEPKQKLDGYNKRGRFLRSFFKFLYMEGESLM